MSLVDYPLFSWVVVIHSLYVSSFREAHHQEIIFPVQSANYNDARNNECKRNMIHLRYQNTKKSGLHDCFP